MIQKVFLLYLSIYRQVQFFEKCREENGDNAIHMLCRVIKYQYIPQNTSIINYGEYGSQFYIILKGEVNNKQVINIGNCKGSIHSKESGHFERTFKIFS